jgi:arylsulfatase A-like enzyme
LDNLVKRGVYFRKAYCHSPTCGPSRASIRTGCTVERTGVQSNQLVRKLVYQRMEEIFERKVLSMVTYDKALVELGYVAEIYGKWHLPPPLYMGGESRKRIISNDDYSFKTGKPRLSREEVKPIYKRRLNEMLTIDQVTINNVQPKNFTTDQQDDRWSGYPYTPIRLDERYGKPPQSRAIRGADYAFGAGTTPELATPTAMIGRMAIKALDRLSKLGNPWCLTVSFNSPHPPTIALSSYAEYYNVTRSSLYVSESAGGDMTGNAYEKVSNGNKMDGFGDIEKIQEWTAIYYALIEEGMFDSTL